MIALFVSAGLILLLDQVTKSFIEARSGATVIRCSSLLQLHPLTNRRRVYGSAIGRAVFLLVWFFALASAVALYKTRAPFHEPMVMLAIGTALGGAAGNLTDILRTRSVSDFIDFRFWPAFNLADVAIIGGLIVAFWSAT